ncbi:hypothetical protein AB0878_46365 [Amycolatopsis sp. NPDC047767]|uniref:hypothetical protein n=1 Tax=Amycolatopsis sp. NPDC047767 TaxID=3156765 RepID=UPI003451C867
MLTTLNYRITTWWLAAIELFARRREEFRRAGERGDENITKALYAALAVGVATLIAGAITAFVNGKLPLIGGQ